MIRRLRGALVAVHETHSGTVTVALTGAQRAAVSQGTAVMIVRVKIAGKRREATYLLG